MLVRSKNNVKGSNNLMNQLFENEYVNKLERRINTTKPKANIQEMEKKYQIDMMAPGFKKEYFNLEVVEDQLKVSAKIPDSKEDNKEEDNHFTHQEFATLSIERNFNLSHKIDSGKISATYQDGILSIEVPKKEETIVKRVIEIK